MAASAHSMGQEIPNIGKYSVIGTEGATDSGDKVGVRGNDFTWNYSGVAFEPDPFGGNPTPHAYNYQIRIVIHPITGIWTRYEFSNSCGEDLVWELNTTTGAVSVTGSLAATYSTLNQMNQDCPYEGFNGTGFSPGADQFIDDTVDYESTENYAKITTNVAADAIYAGSAAFTVVAEFTLAGSASTGRTIENVLETCLANIDGIDINNLALVYDDVLLNGSGSLQPLAIDVGSAAGVYNSLEDGFIQTLGAAVFPERRIIVVGTSAAIKPDQPPSPPIPSAMLRAKFTPLTPATFVIEEYEARKSLIYVSTEACAVSSEYSELIPAGSGSAVNPSLTGVTDCSPQHFSTPGYHIIHPNDMPFQYGEIVVYPKTGNEFVTDESCTGRTWSERAPECCK
jgi:hypothetical protein